MKLSEIIGTSSVFPDAKPIKVEDILGKAIEIIAFTQRTGEKGDFFVFLAKLEGEQISFYTGSKIVMEKVLKATEHFQLKDNPAEAIVAFPENLQCTIKQVKSGESGNKYYDII